MYEGRWEPATIWTCVAIVVLLLVVTFFGIKLFMGGEVDYLP